jgi:acetyl-CoA carboxylase biotin carboxyl carrier protein
MNLKELKEIIDIFSSRESIEELELEKSGVRLRIRRASANHGAVAAVAIAPAPIAAVAAPAPAALPRRESPEDTEEALYYVKSPIVGTYYKSPSPGDEPFVSVGDFVEKGTVVCIIEAMKLMNEIESDVAGEVVSVLVENGQPVEYGERLFAIRPR